MKADAFQIGLAFGLGFREYVSTVMVEAKDALAFLPLDSETLKTEVMALLNFAFTYGMASAVGTRGRASVPGDLQDRMWNGFFAGFRPTTAESDLNYDRVREYDAALKTEDSRKLSAVGAVFAKHIGYEGHAGVIKIGVDIYMRAFELVTRGSWENVRPF